MSAQRNQAGGITGCTPSKGPFHGHNVVSIVGMQLSSGDINDIAHVAIKGVKVEKVMSVDENKIVVRTASMEGSDREPGRGDVVVVSHSKGVTTGKHMYEYKDAPLIYEIQPDNGAHKGGTSIIIQGDNLCDKHDHNDNLAVQICDQPATNVQCRGDKVIATTGKLNPTRSSENACDVLIQSATFGHSRSHHSFTYRQAPVITHVTPREGRYEGGNKIKIFGSDLTAGQGHNSETVQVHVDGKEATVLDYAPSSILVEVPRGIKKTGFVNIKVTSERHGEAKATGMYRIHREPVIKHLSAKTGRSNGGQHLTLYGSGLGKGDIEHVHIGEHRAKVLWADPRGRKIKVVTPKFEQDDEGRLLSVRVKSRHRGHAKINKGFKVMPSGQIFQVSPLHGPATGGTLVTVTGKHLGGPDFEDYALVKVNDAPATIVSATADKVVLRTKVGFPGADGNVKIYSRHHGITKSPGNMKFQYGQTGQVASIKPAMSNSDGGEQVVLLGERLCNAACDDLEHVQLGNAKITDFVSKSAKRIVFNSPSAAQAGGHGAKTVTVRSKESGDAESPSGFLYLEGGSAGVAWPHDAPLNGKSTVVITGPNLGTAEEYRVILAGVEAKVLSASAQKIEVQVGDASLYARKNQLDTSEGLKGNVIIETLLQGSAKGMDTQIQFEYNPECHIDRVESTAGPADGFKTLLISGHNLGMGDERVYVNGQPVETGFTVRNRLDNDVHQLQVRATSAEEPASIVLKSARSGECKWTKATAATAATQNTEKLF